jgi:hypothetical protein
MENAQVNSGEQTVNSHTLNCSPFNLLYYLSFYYGEQW